jgi:membrane-associated phospholipid phosphatase
MNLKKIIWIFLLAVLLIAGSFYFLDKDIALFVKATWLSPKRLSFSSANIPDVLTPLVCAVTAISWGAYFYLAHKRVHNTQTQFFLLVACAVPVAFILKSILKYVVGRINARFWVAHPGFKDFHWFHGSGCYTGFPSGHMAVFTVLALALWSFYPRYRFAYAGFLLMLATALIATDYHFLSDVIAGTFLGLAVHVSVLHGLAVVRDRMDRKGTL